MIKSPCQVAAFVFPPSLCLFFLCFFTGYIQIQKSNSVLFLHSHSCGGLNETGRPDSGTAIHLRVLHLRLREPRGDRAATRKRHPVVAAPRSAIWYLLNLIMCRALFLQSTCTVFLSHSLAEKKLVLADHLSREEFKEKVLLMNQQHIDRYNALVSWSNAKVRSLVVQRQSVITWAFIKEVTHGKFFHQLTSPTLS